jgi:Gas vesicle protein
MSTPANSTGRLPQTMGSRQPAQLADVLERVLDKGIVIAGDIQINLLDIELLTIRLRLLVASADKAREMGIDWWEGDPFLGRGRGSELEDRLKRLEAAAGLESGDGKEPSRRREDEQSR